MQSFSRCRLGLLLVRGLPATAAQHGGGQLGVWHPGARTKPTNNRSVTTVANPGVDLPSELSAEGVCSPLRELWREPTAELSTFLLGQGCRDFASAVLAKAHAG